MFIRLSEGTSTISIVSLALKVSGNTMVIYSSRLSTNSPNVGSQKKGGGVFCDFFLIFMRHYYFLRSPTIILMSKKVPS